MKKRHSKRTSGVPNSIIGATKEEIQEWAKGMIAKQERRYYPGFSRPGPNEVLEMKLAMLKRDGNDPVCYWCQKPFPKNARGELDFFYATLEHIVPLYLRGKHELHNCAFACRKCNNERDHEDGSAV